MTNDDLPKHARERLADMRAQKLFTSDLSVSEFLLVKEAGFDPLGLVMGSSLYQITPTLPQLAPGQPGCELVNMTRALYHARELAMNRMEEEAAALGADGVVGVRLTVKLGTNPVQWEWDRYRDWQDWARGAGFPRTSTLLGNDWQQWGRVAAQMWSHYCGQLGWSPEPPAPWMRPRAQTTYSFGQNVAEFLAIGCAVRHRGGESYKNVHGKPFQSDLSGQDFWTLIRTGYRPVGFVMGNCVYYVPPQLLQANATDSRELSSYTHALYDARELATERLQDEAEALQATGIVGVTFAEREHSGRVAPWNAGNAALVSGEVIELFVIGTAVVPSGRAGDLAKPFLVLSANTRRQPRRRESDMRPTPALSELSVTEFLTLTRAGYFPHGLVIGSSIFEAGNQYDWTVATREVTQLSLALRSARGLAISRMRQQAQELGAEGVVDVRVQVEHDVWRGARQVAKFIAMGTAVGFDAAHAHADVRSAPSLHLSDGTPFTSDLTAPDFVTLLRAGYRPVAIAMGACVYGLDPRHLRAYQAQDAEVAEYTQAFFDARETAMDRLQQDLFAAHPEGTPDAPAGIVGVTVSEAVYGGGRNAPIVEFSAIGTAVAELAPNDPRRGPKHARPQLVVPLDR